MKKHFFVALAALAGGSILSSEASAQNTIVAEEVTAVTFDKEVPCKTLYNSSTRQNWYIQLGAGIDIPYVENMLYKDDAKRRMQPNFMVGFGRWWSPFFSWRASASYRQLKWNGGNVSRAKMGEVDFDIMWDAFNSVIGVDAKRPVSIIPFVGVGVGYARGFQGDALNVYDNDGKLKKTSWTVPVSAGIQFRFRTCDYVDLFLEGRLGFFGDNFNNTVGGKPIDINATAVAGISINLGGREFDGYNPCDDIAYVESLNNQINELRGDLAATGAALAAAESQLPCPEVTVVECPEPAPAPILATVRFDLNSAKITAEEEVNVYNVAQYLAENPDLTIVVRGYADKDTGTSNYNMTLSEKRATAVANELINKYGINPNRLVLEAAGSDTQIYDTNNWNRIVIFIPVE
ncbi:MAG: OmpA family protein [Odoribacter sp.]|nr:OmpA family protein [Odoribacter sp.]